MKTVELSEQEGQYIRSLLSGQRKHTPADDNEIAAILLERIAETVSDTRAQKLRELAAKMRTENADHQQD